MSGGSTRSLTRIRSEIRQIVSLGAPLIAAQLAVISMNFVDTVMAGRLSAGDLAAVAVGSNLWSLMLFLNIGVMSSVSPTVAHLYGAGRFRDIGRAVRSGLWVSQLMAFSSFILLRSAAGPLLAWMQVDPEIVPRTLGFLDAITWGMPAMCAFQALRSFNEAVSRTKPIMVISLLGLAVNIVGNYAFIYGNWGMPMLGAIGCGVASAIGMWFMLGAMLVYLTRAGSLPDIRLFPLLERPDWKQIRNLLLLGVPIGMALFMEGSLFTTVGLWMGAMGTYSVAAHQIALNVASITFMIPLGLSMAITVRVGQAIGRQDVPGARFSGFVGVALAGAFMAAAGLFLLFFPDFIAAIYTTDARVSGLAVRLLFLAAVFQVFDGLQVSGNAALRGLKDTRVPMAMTFLAYWAVGIPLGYILGIMRGGGPEGVWSGIIAGLLTAAVLLNTRFHRVTARLVRGGVHS